MSAGQIPSTQGLEEELGRRFWGGYHLLEFGVGRIEPTKLLEQSYEACARNWTPGNLSFSVE